MSENKETMQLEYKFMAEDTNLTTTIEEMEGSLEGFNSKTKKTIEKLSKAEKEMKSFANMTASAKRNIKDAESAMNFFNKTSDKSNKSFSDMSKDIERATKLTKELSQEQKRLSNLSINHMKNGATKSEIKDLASDIKSYKAKIIELNSLESRIKSGHDAIKNNLSISRVGLKGSEKGSDEEKFFNDKVKAFTKGSKEYKDAISSFTKEKEKLFADIEKSSGVFNKVLRQNGDDDFVFKNNQKSFKNNSKNNQKRTKSFLNTQNETQSNSLEENGIRSRFNTQRGYGYSQRRAIALTKEEAEVAEKTDRIITENAIKRDDAIHKNKMNRIKAQGEMENFQHKERLKEMKELIETRTQSEIKKDDFKTKNDIKKAEIISKSRIERDDNRSKNKKEEIQLSKKLNLENQKALTNYREEIKTNKRLNATRKELIDKINKQTNKYENLSKEANNYKQDITDISKETDKVIRQNTLEENSFDRIDKKMRDKSKSLLEYVNKIEDYQAESKKLIQSSMDYKEALSNKKIKLEVEAYDLEKLGDNSEETKAKLEKLKTEIREIDSEMDRLDDSTRNLTMELNRAGEEVSQFGMAFSKLEDKIDNSKASIDSFENKAARLANSGAKISSSMANAGKNISGFGKNVKGVGAEISNLGREMQTLSYIGAGIFGFSFSLGLDYEGELANVKSTINTVGKEAGYLEDAMDKIDTKVREVSSKSIYSPSETMQMAKYLSLAGYDLDKILGSIESMSTLMAVSGIEDASTGVDLLTDSFASLGLGIKQVNESDVDFAKRFEEEVKLYMDTLAKMQSVSNQDIQQAMQAYIYSGGEFNRLNIPLEQSGALLSVLASRGLKSAEAGRGLSSVLINLTKDTGASYDALKELKSLTGIDVFAKFDENGNYKIEEQLTNITTAFEKLHKVYGDSKGAEIVNRLTGGIAGKTQIKTFSKLLEGYTTEYTQIRDLLKEDAVSGSMDDMLERKADSIQYKFEMMTSSIEESLVNLFNVLKPYIEKAIELITKLSDSFRNLSDDDKLQLAKLLGFATILPIIIIALGGIIQVVGTAITAIGTLITVFSKLGTGVFKTISKFLQFKRLLKSMNFASALGEIFPNLKPIIDDMLIPAFNSIKGFASNMINTLSTTSLSIKGIFSSIGKAFTTGGFVAGFKSILLVGTKIIAMIALIITAFTFMKDLFSNWGDLGFFKSLEHAFVNLVNTIGKCIAKIVGLFNRDWGKDLEENLTGFKSKADREAEKKGYTGYDEMKKSESPVGKIQNELNELLSGDYNIDLGINFEGSGGIGNGINTWTNGAIGRLIEGINSGETGEVSSETIDEYKAPVKDVVNQYEYIQSLKKQGQRALKEENEITNKMLKTREEMAKHSKECADYERLQQEYNQLSEQKKEKAQFRKTNEEELDARLKEYEENALVISVKYKEAQENGVGEEFFYNNFGEYFQQEFGIELVFKNKEESINNLNKLKENLPELKQGLEIELETAEGDYKNQIMEKLVQLEKLELAIPVALEIVETEEKMLEFLGPNGKLSKAEEKVLKIETDMNGVEKGSKAWEDLNNQHKEAKEELKKVQDEYDNLNKELEELESKNPQVFENAIELAKILAENPGLNLTNFLTGDKYFDGSENTSKKGNEYINKNYNENGTKKTEKQKKAEKEKAEEAKKIAAANKKKEQEKKKKVETAKDYASNYDYVNPHGMPIMKLDSDAPNQNKITESAKKDVETAKEVVENTTINPPKVEETSENSITENVKEDVESAKEVVENTTINPPKVEETSENSIAENVKEDVEGAKTSMDELSIKASEIKGSFGEIDMSNLVEVFSVVLTLADTVRQRIIDIGNVANNHLKNNLSGAGDGLLEKLSIIREALIGLGDIANNYVRNSINNIGEGLKTSFNSAREVLLSICNVALNRGVNSMNTLGNALSTSLNGGRDKLLSICNVALNRGQSAMASMGQALTSSLQGALSIVSRVASTVNDAVRKANNIKIPSIPTMPNNLSANTMMLSAPQSLSKMLRDTSLTNNSYSTVNTSSRSFNFAIDKVISNSNSDLKNTAKRLTTYCKRRGLF